MNIQPHLAPRMAGGEPPSAARLQGRWRALARVGWGTLVVFTLTVFFANLPEFLARLRTPCSKAACVYLQLQPEQVEWLAGVGRSSMDYAAVLLAVTLALFVLCLLVSALIIWRRPDDRMALLVAFMLVAVGPNIEIDNLHTWPSLWQGPLEVLDFLEVALVVLVFSLFPSGRFVPRWTRWPLVVVLATLVPYSFFPMALPLPGLVWCLVLGESAILVVAQLYRYRRVSGPLERQQTKLVVFGASVSAVFWIGAAVLLLLFPTLSDPTSPAGPPYFLVLNSVGTSLVLLIPLTFGIAMLRYRLWEIDSIINKALVYGLLTGLLGSLYAGLILGLESLGGLVTGQAGQPVVLVVSTLVIAALFLPVRRRFQGLIDRRFFRKKYDAEQTLAAFSALLRNQVDLEQIREQLLAAVSETMQPAHVSLWLRPVKPQAAEGGARAARRGLAAVPSSAERLEAG